MYAWRAIVTCASLLSISAAFCASNSILSASSCASRASCSALSFSNCNRSNLSCSSSYLRCSSSTRASVSTTTFCCWASKLNASALRASASAWVRCSSLSWRDWASRRFAVASSMATTGNGGGDGAFGAGSFADLVDVLVVADALLLVDFLPSSFDEAFDEVVFFSSFGSFSLIFVLTTTLGGTPLIAMCNSL